MNNFPSSYKVPKWLNLDEEVGGVRGHILCYYFNDIHFEKLCLLIAMPKNVV